MRDMCVCVMRMCLLWVSLSVLVILSEWMVLLHASKAATNILPACSVSVAPSSLRWMPKTDYELKCGQWAGVVRMGFLCVSRSVPVML